MRDTVRIRYALLPFLYSEFMKSALTDGMYFRPLAFDYPEDSRAVHTEDQVLLGEGCMIAPVTEQNAAGRHVYLPEEMLMIRFRSPEDYDLVSLSAGDHWIDCSLREFPLFVRKNFPVLLCPGGECSDLLDDRTYTVLCLADREISYDLYRDNGLDPDPVLAEHLTRISVSHSAPGDSSLPRVAISRIVI